MTDYKPQNPEEHFALQRTTRAAEIVKAVFEAQQKGNEESRGRDERFYSSLALFSSGTIALSVTFLGYLKNAASKPIQHPHWLIACWICLLTCILCSLFWLRAYGHYTHYFHEWQTANAQKEQFEAEAKEYPVLARNAFSVQTRAAMSAQESRASYPTGGKRLRYWRRKQRVPRTARSFTCDSGACLGGLHK